MPANRERQPIVTTFLDNSVVAAFTLRGPNSGPRFRLYPASQMRLPFSWLWHQNSMHPDNDFHYQFRIPSEPEPFPVKEPPDSPENPDMPVREPDPDQPFQI